MIVPVDTEFTIKNNLTDFLSKLNERVKFVTILVLAFKKIEGDDETKYSTFYSNSKAETIINESDTNYVFKSIYITIISNIQKSLGKGSGWITNPVIIQNINVSKYNKISSQN